VYEIVLQPDGKILAGGAFTNYQGASSNRIIRLNTNGSRDNSFTIGTGANNIVYSIELADSGRIIIAGSFTTFNGVSKTRIAMLKATGALHTPFTTNITNGIVYDVRKIGKGYLLGGTFTTVNGTPQARLSFVDSAGIINNTLFYTGTGVDNLLSHIYVDTVQKGIFLSGNFTVVQNKLYNRFARLTYSNIRLTKIATTLCPGAITKVYFDKNGTYNPGNVFTVQLSDSLGNFTNPINIGAKSNNTTGADSITVYFPNNLSFGNNYRVRIISSNLEDISNISQAIWVGTPQQPTVTASSALVFCEGDSVLLTSSAGTSYTWSNGSNTQTITVKNTGSYTVTVNKDNCIASSNPVNTTAMAAPDSSVKVEIASLCGSGSVKLSGQPGLTYAWNIGPTTQSITVSQDGSYTLTVTDSIGCHSSSTTNLDLTTFFSTLIYPSGATTFCEGGNVVLHTIPGLASYLWSNGQTTDSIIVTTGGVYTVTISDGICSKNSNAVSVTVNPLPTVNFSLPQDTFCHSASSVSLSATPGGGVFSGSGVNGNTFNPAGLAGSSVVVTYTYTGGNGCTNTIADTAYVALCTGVGDLTDNVFSVSPNPATEYIYIKGLTVAPYHIEITNALGAVMMKLDVSNSLGDEKLNLSGLAQGQYIMRINNRKFRFVKL
jgi:hypothetical protein